MKFFKFIFKCGIFVAVCLSIIAAISLFYYCHDLPSLDTLENQSSKHLVQINYIDEKSIIKSADIYSSEVNFYELPKNLINAVIATEDRRFFSHHAIDVIGILRAAYINHKAGKVVQGGSTITQQLAKLLFLKPEKTVKRKIQEILLAVQLEQKFTKEQILTFYLNRAYFGSGNYGIASASKHFFNKDVSRLNLQECAIIAGLLKAPSKLSPKNNRELSLNRASTVISNMIDAGFLDEKDLSQLNQEASYNQSTSQYLYFTDFVSEQFEEFLSKKKLSGKSVITTTLQESVQDKVEKITNKFTQKNSKKLGKSEVAAVVMKKDGAISAMIGGKDYQKSQFNRAVYAKRQAGSAFKTFVYLTAFENGFTPQDVFEDKKTNVGSWLPDNYENQYLGNVTLKKAFANSLNSVAVQLAKKVGVSKVATTAKDLGILSKIDKSDPTIALGTTQVSLLELAGAYAAIANNGEAVIPYSILKIKNDDKILYERESSGVGSIFSEKSINYMKEVLREVVESGTGKNANIAKNIYGKTGTSQNFRDAWFVGFNDEYVIAIWIGNDDNSATNKITGGSLPALLFAEIIKNI